MRRFSFKKLVRDKIISGIKSSGNKPIYHKLSDKDFIHELKKKLMEEAEELFSAGPKELSDELADIQEIIDHLKETINLSSSNLRKLQKEKNSKRGSFKKRHYIDHVETKDNSEWIGYYLKSPHKYPEITD